ncbi:MAG: tyrosine-protein phosphatase [Thermodesulfobacteriota bacterium]|nr:tyrosine-protein phosphatase [Thermodesulfobacteriota bacterium]
MHRSTKRAKRRGNLRVAAGALLVAAACVGALYGYWAVLDHRFWAVSEGKVYRSAAMPPERLVKKARGYGIKTVIDLRRDPDEVAPERSALAEVGVRHLHLPSKQVPTEETVRGFLEIMDRQEYQPVLIHCEHGEGRAPLFSAIYRIEFEGWSKDRARRASSFLPFRGNFAPDSRKGMFLRNYVPRRQRNTQLPSAAVLSCHAECQPAGGLAGKREVHRL